VEKGALPENVLKVVDEVWKMVKDDAPVGVHAYY